MGESSLLLPILRLRKDGATQDDTSRDFFSSPVKASTPIDRKLANVGRLSYAIVDARLLAKPAGCGTMAAIREIYPHPNRLNNGSVGARGEAQGRAE